MKRATHQGILTIGNIEIPCFVLEDETRVISGRGMTHAIGMKGRGQGIARIHGYKTLKPFINKELEVAIQNPIRFLGRGSRKINPTQGYEATILLKVCEAILTARDAGVLKTEQEKRYAYFCDILVRAFAKVGIIALVDEATGYQKVRDNAALQKILDKYLLPEFAKWAKRFPDEFYKRMFALKGWHYSPLSISRPSVVGTYTNDIIYSRLAPGILAELRRLNPPDEKGHRKVKHHQWLTKDIGHPKLQEHLLGIITLMKASANWLNFKRLVERVFPKQGETLPLLLEDEREDANGD